MKLLFKKIALVHFFLFAISCQTSTKLNFKKSGEIAKLNSDFTLQGYMGNNGVQIPEKELLARYLHIPNVDPEEYVIIVEPHLASDVIEIPDAAPLNGYAIPAFFYRYFDLLMRAHRSFLQRDFEKSEKILEELDKTYDVTYGSLVLSANIAIFKGNKEKAAVLFKKAKNMYKDSVALNNLIKN